MSKVPPAPPRGPLNRPTAIGAANTKLNTDESASRHSRSRHVGMSDTNLKGRGIATATSFKSAHDQNKAAAAKLGTPAANNAANRAVRTGTHQAVTVPGSVGRTASIARVAQGGRTFNAKVTESKMVMQGGSGKVLTTYPTKFTALPKPAAGPNLKPGAKTTVPSIAGGAAALRKVPAPVARTGMPVGKVVTPKPAVAVAKPPAPKPQAATTRPGNTPVGGVRANAAPGAKPSHNAVRRANRTASNGQNG